MDPERRSLMQLHPRRLDIPALCLAALALLSAAMCMPVITLKKMVLWKDTYSILSGIELMRQQKEYALAALIFMFSVVFPYVKLAGLLYLWFVPVKQPARQAALDWLGLMGKWSMLDVFIVAITVVVVKLGVIAEARPREGIYVFTLAVLMSIVITAMIEGLAKRNSSSGPAKYSI